MDGKGGGDAKLDSTLEKIQTFFGVRVRINVDRIAMHGGGLARLCDKFSNSQILKFIKKNCYTRLESELLRRRIKKFSFIIHPML